jgi:glyoxylase-like metal-dependent hydrolase (beta-lactamase superfamily II)
MTILHRIFPALLLALCWLPPGFNSAREIDRITVTILYDNTTAVEGVQADWGFACLVEGLEQTILFDTGTKSEVLLHNAQVLGKDLAQVDVLVLSHDHRDHTGALVMCWHAIRGFMCTCPYLSPPRMIPSSIATTLHRYV